MATPHQRKKQVRYDNTELERLICLHRTNEEIRAVLGPLPPYRISSMRRKHGIMVRMYHGRAEEEAKAIVKPSGRYRPPPARCPKCRGYVQTNVGYPTYVAWSCFCCGLTSESNYEARKTNT